MPGDTASTSPGELDALYFKRDNAPEFIALHSLQHQSSAFFLFFFFFFPASEIPNSILTTVPFASAASSSGVP